MRAFRVRRGTDNAGRLAVRTDARWSVAREREWDLCRGGQEWTLQNFLEDRVVVARGGGPRVVEDSPTTMASSSVSRVPRPLLLPAHETVRAVQRTRDRRGGERTWVVTDRRVVVVRPRRRDDATIVAIWPARSRAAHAVDARRRRTTAVEVYDKGGSRLRLPTTTTKTTKTRARGGNDDDDGWTAHEVLSGRRPIGRPQT